MGANNPLLKQLSPGFWTLFLLASLLLGRHRKSLSVLSTWLGTLFGLGTVRLSSARNTVLLKLKSSANRSSDGKVALRELIEPLLPPVRLNPSMFNGHVHTLAVALGKGGKDSKIHYKRKEWESTNEYYPGHFTTDFVIPPPKQPLPRDRSLPPRTHNFSDDEWTQFLSEDSERPLVILSHGFLGGSHEKYIRHSLDVLTSAKGPNTDFAAVVMNSRGCAYSRVTSNILYNPRSTWDVRQFVQWARQQWPQRKLFAVGYSIGANVLCNYLGEEGDACPLDAAVLVGNPWNLDISNAILASSVIGRQVYLRNLGTAFRKTFERHIDQISKNPAINVENARKSTFLFEWDKQVQCPTYGYPTVSSYHRDASSADAVLGIKVPTLAIHADDDPVCSIAAVPLDHFDANPYVVFCSTSIGGHLGWFETGGGRWSDRVIRAFLQKIVNDTDGVEAPATSSQGVVLGSNPGFRSATFDPLRRRLFWPEVEKQ